MNRRLMVFAHAAAAALISLVSGWMGSGILLCVVAPLLLVRFVSLDRESTMVGVMCFTALLTVMAHSERGPGGAMTVALGGFVAAEVAARGARLRRAAPLARLEGDLLPTLVVVAVASAAGLASLAFAALDLPAIAAVTGLALLVTGLFVVVLRRPEAPDEPLRQFPWEP
jgi:hypothetical protein